MSSSIHSLSESHRLDQIPAFPPVLLALMNACQQAEPSMREVETLASQDPTVAMRLLAIASSPVYARGRPSSSVKEAVQRLGLTTVNTIAVTTGIHEFFSGMGGRNSPWLADFWRQSLGAALAARAISRQVDGVNAEEAFLAGLLHDVGLPLLSVMYPEAMDQVREDVALTNRPLVDVEQEILGISHDQLGSSMVERWGLPDFLVDAILYCHAPVDQLENAHPLVRVVHVASLIAQAESGPDAQALHASARLLDLGRAATARLFNEILQERDTLLQSLGEVRQDAPAASGEGQYQLMDNTRNAALLGSIRPHLRYQGDNSEVEAIARGLVMLFGLRHCTCLQVAPSGDHMLASVPMQPEEKLDALKIPLERSASLFARCLLDNHPMDTLDPQTSAGLSVLDRQIIRRLPGDGVLCLPMWHQGTAVGVLALGIRHTQISAMVDQSELMLAYAGEAAALLYQASQAQQQLRSTHADGMAREDSRIRQLSNELSTPITVINNYLHILQQQIDDQHPGHENLLVVADEIERVGDLLRQLGEAANAAAPEPVDTDVNQMVREVMVLARESQLLPMNLAVHQQLDPRLDGLPAPVTPLRKLLLKLFGILGGAVPAAGPIQLQTSTEVWLDGLQFQEMLLTMTGNPSQWRQQIQQQIERDTPAFNTMGGRLSWSANAGKGIRVQVLWQNTKDNNQDNEQ